LQEIYNARVISLFSGLTGKPYSTTIIIIMKIILALVASLSLVAGFAPQSANSRMNTQLEAKLADTVSLVYRFE
jgi:hypothetical protein